MELHEIGKFKENQLQSKLKMPDKIYEARGTVVTAHFNEFSINTELTTVLWN